jgi:hypothetical protein
MNLDLSWLTGTWLGNVWGGEMEEHWTSQSGGTLLGMNRVVRDGKTVHKEFIFIESTENGTSLSVSLFRQPEETVHYCLSDTGDRKAVFSNREHSRLQKISYRRHENDLVITLEGERAQMPFRDEITLRPAN